MALKMALKEGWMGTGIPERSCAGTYQLYDAITLPPLARNFDGSFDWLRSEPERTEWAIFGKLTDTRPLIDDARKKGLELPTDFLRFFEDRTLNGKIRSVTACSLSLPKTWVSAPGLPGHLAHFLIDQQGCVFWYLHIDGASARILASQSYFGPDEGLRNDAADDALYICAPDFERFLYRYWLENELAFARGAPTNAAGEAYLEHYRRQNAR